MHTKNSWFNSKQCSGMINILIFAIGFLLGSSQLFYTIASGMVPAQLIGIALSVVNTVVFLTNIRQYLIYYEEFKRINPAIKREMELKAWRRSRKDAFIKYKKPQSKASSVAKTKEDNA